MNARNTDSKSVFSSFRKGLLCGATIAAMGAGLVVPSFTVSALGAGFLDDIEINSGTVPVIDATKDLPSLAGSFLAAQIAGANGDDAIAIENYKRAIELDGENSDLKQLMIMAMTANGDITDAIDTLGTIPAEEQNRSLNQVIVAANALKQKSWKRVITNIDRVAGADLDMMISKLVGSWAMFGDRRIDEALERAKDATGPDWVSMIREYHVGLMLAASGKDSEAIVSFEKAVGYRAVAAALTETYMRAVESLARSKARTGDLESARKVVSDGLELLPAYPPLRKLEETLAETNEGKTIGLLVTTAQEGGAEVFYNVGSAISRQGSLPFAQSHLQIARFLAPENDGILFALANVYEEQDKYVLANDYYTRIAETSPHYRRSQLEIALNLNRMEQVPEAITTLKALVEQDPDDLQTVLSLGGVYGQHEQYANAAELYDQAIARISSPERQHWPVFYRRGIAHERTKQWPLAEADFKKALELFPDQPDVLNYLGYSWIDQGINLDEGLSMVKKAVELRPNSGFIIDSLGWAYYRLGRYEDAVVELQRALEQMPSDPVINDHLGDAYWKTGRKLEAVFQWKHALANKPTEEDRFKITRKLQVGLTH